MRNVRIESVEIGFNHGLLTAVLFLNDGSATQGFGGWTLGFGGTCATFLTRVMQVVGVGTWDDLVGKTCRVEGSDMKAEAIGHILKDEWFWLSELEKDGETKNESEEPVAGVT